MLGIVSSCALVTLSLRRACFPIFDFKKCRNLEIRVTSIDWVYGLLLVFYRNFDPQAITTRNGFVHKI